MYPCRNGQIQLAAGIGHLWVTGSVPERGLTGRVGCSTYFLSVNVTVNSGDKNGEVFFYSNLRRSETIEWQ